MQIEVGSLVALAVTFSAALLVSWTLLTPFFSSQDDSTLTAQDGDRDSAVHLSELQRRKDNTFAALEELEHELSSGKISHDEYQLSKAELTRDAARYIQQLEDAEGRIKHTEAHTSEEASEHESNSH